MGFALLVFMEPSHDCRPVLQHLQFAEIEMLAGAETIRARPWPGFTTWWEDTIPNFSSATTSRRTALTSRPNDRASSVNGNLPLLHLLKEIEPGRSKQPDHIRRAFEGDPS